jgi:hypothetical protein
MDNKRMIVIPSGILKTNKTDGYFQLFYLIRGDFKTNEEVYYHIETTREHYGLERKFSTYESFKTMKTRFDAKNR